MKMADILRGIADKLDSIGSDVQSEVEPPAEPKDFAQPEQDNDDAPGVMIPPLQQKLELLKKGVGVPSAYDQDGNGVPDDLDAIKKLTGIKAVIQHEASDDEPLDL
jgi:hypothetical protein